MFKNFLTTINDPQRNLAIDYCRALAILTVVGYHFQKYVPFGYLGVDLFFLISGYLVSRPLFKAYLNDKPMFIKDFIIRRAFKIWPSYYVFLFMGSIWVFFVFRNTRPEFIIDWDHVWAYVVFLMNYRGYPHSVFGHLWSICVEEHFYILLPLGFFALSYFKRSLNLLLIALVSVVLTGTALKGIGYFVGFETYSATHNRIDALTMGVILSIAHHKQWLNRLSQMTSLSLVVLGLGSTLVWIFIHGGANEFYQKFWFHSLVGLSLFIFMFGLLNLNLPNIKWLRFFAYFSYNWYLWHTITAETVAQEWGVNFDGFAIYFFGSLLVAMFFTFLIEEPSLKLRNRFVR